MAERPDLRQIAGDIRQALEGLDRDALAEILAYVFKEYVVEGPPPLRAQEVEQVEDLAGLSFAELVTTLQTRLGLAELALFQVEGGRVRVRAGGALVEIDAGAARAAAERAEAASAPAPAPSPAAPAVPREASRSTVDEAIARGRGDLVGERRGVVEPPAPRPRGVSVTGRPQTGADPSRSRSPSATPAAPAPESGEAPAAASLPAEPPAEPPAEGAEDDASVRFSLLELD